MGNSCKLCGSTEIKMEYEGLIRDGGLGKYTKRPVTMYRCCNCDVIWHEPVFEIGSYYESKEYRNALEGTTDEYDFYRLHDKDNLDKFQYTGTDIFRGKVVADIGCGCGAFLDFIRGAAERVIAIEPSEIYRKIMDKKGYLTFAYASQAKSKLGNSVDVAMSFDVIEHVSDPLAFLQDIYDLLNVNGQAIIGTPTDAPIMRSLLGEIYERELLFSTQHIWIFSEKNLNMLAKQVGFSSIGVKYYQRYGIGNMIGWLKEKKAKADIQANFLTNTLDAVWRSECSSNGMADYIVLYLEK